ncbi:xanthine dehydrogenase family protein subunit M [Amycolatopsis acidiphila]|uniref:Xanthine dehydrogenase family protein subunit M n=1 Tax=Amycolatopsis acidiphila TaxID=715473 RepID=A0A558ANY3_9PSEU|nr:xanthine dehydrogenase family protein subunit M [Amycolatopsis acidiphila]TVT25961.1 xanthine dehydrogenase family protein subunit M [Amycolatopsis acidiphila]UIJ63327.1 xanthine dehydrogenase family protein subunit M [Amycolatopsis acidiphila]GHG75050.1 carbon-monoxide dehydrogenase medium subunit [Amycolatopsis acidiphila]
MKPAPFAYHRPTSVAEAVARLGEYGGGARVLAGGQSLVPMLNMRLWRPDALVDINDIDDLDDILPAGDRTVLGALVRYSTVERSPLVAERLPLLARIVRHIGDRQVRNRGTVGGALVQGDPTGELPLACLVLGAVVVAAGPAGTRRIPLAEFYEGPYATVLDPGELVVAVEFPAHPQHFAFREFCRKHNDFAVISAVATGNRDEDGTWHGVRLALGGVADSPVLAPSALEGSRLTDDDVTVAAEAALTVVDPPTDVRASAEYRRHLVPVYVRRVLTELREAQGGIHEVA